MTHDPQRHRRRPLRLKGYDYGQSGAYFVTLCTQDRESLFGHIVDGEMHLNPYGRVAATMWGRIPRHFPHVQLDQWVVMPNHIHGIILFEEPESGRGEAFPERRFNLPGDTSGQSSIINQGPNEECLAPTTPAPTAPKPGSLGTVVGNFKSVTARRINRMRKTPGAPVWQRNYYEHIIRDGDQLHRLRQYIMHNPARWLEDENHPARIPSR